MTGFVVAIHLLTSLVVLALPQLSRRGVLFGVLVPEGFAAQPPARTAIRAYRRAVAVPVAVSLAALVWARPPLLFLILVAAAFGIGAVALLMFVRQHVRLRPYAIRPAGVRDVELSAERPSLPLAGWLGIVPFVLLAVVALYLAAQWDAIPERFPVHWGPGGVADRWSTRSVTGVFGHVLMGVGFSAGLYAFGLATWFGARTSEPLRRPMLVTMVAAEWGVTLLHGAAALILPLGLPAGLLMGAVALLLVSILVPVIHLVRETMRTPQPLDAVPESAWTYGVFYRNPDDAALFVAARAGAGLAMNLASPWIWALLAGLAVMLVLPFALLLWS